MNAPRLSAALVAAAVVAATAAVAPDVGWNETSRAALTAAMVDRATLTIDAYQHGPWATGDRAYHDGHRYSDKAIGTSLLAVPGYALSRVFLEPAGPPASPRPAVVAMRLTAGLVPAAAGVALLHSLLVGLGVAATSAVLVVAFSFFGTMWFGYSTTLYPYVPGIAAMLGALHLALLPPRRWSDGAVSLLAGGCLGLALLMDYAFSPAVAGVGLVRLSRVRGRAGNALALAAGIAPSVALFAAYCHAAFGSFTIPYRFLENPVFREGMSRGVLGVGPPRLAPLWFVTLHPFRGLLVWSPVVLVAWAGAVRWARRGDGPRRAAGLLGVAMLPAYLLLNAGYYMWWGGWAAGPRFVLPALPLVLVGLGAWAPGRGGRSGAWGWRMAQLAGVISVIANVPLALTGVNVAPAVAEQALLQATLGTPLPLANAERVLAFLRGEGMVWLGAPGGLPWARAAGYAGAGLAALATVTLLAAAAAIARDAGGADHRP